MDRRTAPQPSGATPARDRHGWPATGRRQPCSTFGSGSTGKRCRAPRAAAGSAAARQWRGSTVTGRRRHPRPAGAGVASTSAGAGANTIAILGSGDGAGNAMRCSRQTSCQQRQAMRQDRHGERDVSSPDRSIRRRQRQTCDAFSRGRPSGHRQYAGISGAKSPGYSDCAGGSVGAGRGCGVGGGGTHGRSPRYARSVTMRARRPSSQIAVAP